MNYRDLLNEKQYEAVSTDAQYVRIVAGAGSGKTRVLTHRIAYLISEFNVRPYQILAITFTNKVAKEMKTRVNNMIPDCQKDLTIRTFHSFAAYFLRLEINNINYPSSFTILDEEDQTKLIKDIAVSMGYQRKDKIVGRALNYISSKKLKSLYPEDIVIKHENFEGEKDCLEIYKMYEENKARAFSLDFDDLLLKTNYILENFPFIRIKWQNKYLHILIDEFQDTNDVEYKLISLLMNQDTSLYVVGDPDQTIYTWRGANQRIILDLKDIFPSIVTITLERNYRSTQNILTAANKLISHNKLRLKKNLYTESTSGEPIHIRSASNGKLEAEFVAREIQFLVKSKGYSYSDIAILYRSNYLTLEFESALTSKNIPYQIFGGLKFYQRREIKDVLAYFRLLINKKDNISFERIANTPRRGVSENTLTLLKEEAGSKNLSLYEYVESVDEKNTNISKKAFNSLKTMVTLLNDVSKKLDTDDEVFSKLLHDLLVDLSYFEYLRKDDDGDDRVDNVNMLFEDLRHYLKNNPESSMEEYLQNIALLSAQDEIVDGEYVSMMTVHTAKGLEFPIIFLVKFNDSIFPNARALMEGGYNALEEERRLAYVAMTRAKQHLYLSFSSDYSFVVGSSLKPSQFFAECGQPLKENTIGSIYGKDNYRAKPISYSFDDGCNSSFESDVPKKQIIPQPPKPTSNGYTEDDFKIGETIYHRKYGKGTIVAFEGDNIIRVNFESEGEKSLLCNHPAVSKGDNFA